MTVALDATPLTLSSGGLRRYTEELSRALAEEFPQDRYFLLSAREGRWWLWGINRELRRQNADLFFGTNFEVPYLPLRPSVLTLHDLSPWLDPAWHTAAGRVRRRTPWLIRLGIATLIITPTEAVRRQAIEHFRIHPQRVVAVPEAAASHFRPLEPVPGPPYLLYVGALEPRKNLAMLIDAWRAARARCGIDLVLAGRAREGFPLPAAEPGLRMAGEVPDAALPSLYSGATAFVYASRYEGFGLPVLEAMQCGAMVIASRDPAIAEVAGNAALLLDPREPRAWAEAMTAAALNREWRREWQLRALERAREFSWARTARLTREVNLEAMRRFG